MTATLQMESNLSVAEVMATRVPGSSLLVCSHTIFFPARAVEKTTRAAGP